MDNDTESFPIQPIIESYFGLLQELAFENGHVFELEDGRGVCLHLVAGKALLVVVSSTSLFSEEEKRQVAELASRLTHLAKEHGMREIRKTFSSTAGDLLRRGLYLVFISDKEPSFENITGGALSNIEKHMKVHGHIAIGPYNIRAAKYTFSAVVSDPDIAVEDNPAGVILVLGRPLPDRSVIEGIVEGIRSKISVPILIAPGSDDELEHARRYETDLQIELCDSVSKDASYLLVSVLAIMGLTDMHPDLALERWPMDASIDTQPTDESAIIPAGPTGHQAFFVVKKSTGNPVFTYYYVPKAEAHRRAPNIVAAVTSFKMGSAEFDKTSVVQVEDLVYALIEVDDLIFTLVTGVVDDVESLRRQFSFLPDLWKDESPEFVESSEDPYSSPPFTLKILATLPPEEIPGKMCPVRIHEPDWNRFESREVRDFLQAVWGSLDGSIEIQRLSSGSGPNMTLGAIHFLKAMGCIGLKLNLDPSDTPRLVGEVNESLRKLYSHIDKITAMMDGKHTVMEISEEVGIQQSVLISVISDLYSKGIVILE